MVVVYTMKVLYLEQSSTVLAQKVLAIIRVVYRRFKGTCALEWVYFAAACTVQPDKVETEISAMQEL